MSDNRKRPSRSSPTSMASTRRPHAMMCAVLITVASICIGYTVVANMNTYYFSSSEQIMTGDGIEGAATIRHFYAHLHEHNKRFTPQTIPDALFGISSGKDSVTLFSNRAHHPLLHLLLLLLPSVRIDSNICNDILTANFNTSALYIIDCEFGVQSSGWDTIYASYDTAVAVLRRLTSISPSAQVLFLTTLPARTQSTDLRDLHKFLLTKYITSQRQVSLLPEYKDELLFPPDQHPLHAQLCASCLRLLLFVKQAVHNSLPVYQKASDSESLSSAPLQTRCHKLLNTRKYDSKCLPKPEKLIPLLVTSLGGAGTHYSTLTLWKMGLDIKHENIDADGGVV